jgi:hypothetical protein
MVDPLQTLLVRSQRIHEPLLSAPRCTLADRGERALSHRHALCVCVCLLQTARGVTTQRRAQGAPRQQQAAPTKWLAPTKNHSTNTITSTEAAVPHSMPRKNKVCVCARARVCEYACVSQMMRQRQEQKRFTQPSTSARKDVFVQNEGGYLRQHDATIYMIGHGWQECWFEQAAKCTFGQVMDKQVYVPCPKYIGIVCPA